MNQVKFNWLTKFLITFSPHMLMKRFARKAGVDHMPDLLHEAFEVAKLVEIEALRGSGPRGFMLVIDRKLSLWFYQNGDHFEYDGFEMGEYEKGDVTVFDNKH